MHFKKHISLFLAFFLLVSSSGLAFNVHFCEGEFAGISSVFSTEEICDESIEIVDTCCAKPDAEHKKCCSDKEVNLKDKTEKVTLKTIAFNLDFVSNFTSYKPITFCTFVAINYFQKFDYCYKSNAPPFYKLYLQLIFYA